MTVKPKVLFVINSLSGGGAERVLSTLLALSQDKTADYTFSLALLDDEKREYPLPDWLNVHQCDSRMSLWRSVRNLDALVRRERPDVILSFLTRANCATVMVGRLHGAAVVISERVTTSSHLGKGAGGRVARLLVRLTYPRADRIIAVSQGIAQDLASHYGVDRDRINVIANPVDRERIEAQAALAPDIALPPAFAVAVSRLTPPKNVMLVVEALARSSTDLPLLVLGQGPERDAIIARAQALGIADRVILAGFQANPYAIMRQATFFVSGSNAEGFPNSLVEALALGLPVVATNCDSGPAEILADVPRESITALTQAPYGMLVPPNDPDALARAMERVTTSDVHAHYTLAGPQRAQHFGPDKAKDAYWAVIAAALSLRK